MLYFDLDGTLRDIHAACCWIPTDWSEKIEGLSVVEYFNQHLELLTSAPGTKYLEPVLNKYEDISIMTCQPSTWRIATGYWLLRHMTNKITRIHNLTFNDKLSQLKPDDILVEDYPLYPDYSQIILIDRPYNRNIELPHVRVDSPEALFEEIKRRQHGKV